MQFTVPQFIEHEPKIVGPLTFKQFIYIGIAGAICAVLWFTIAEASFFIFFLASLLIMLFALALSFLKINGRSLPTSISNLFKYTLGPKLYLWRKKEMSPRFIKMTPQVKAVSEELQSPLKFAAKSRLKKLSNEMETKF